MSKRKPARASKHARSQKMAAKAHRATQAIVKSPRNGSSFAARSTKRPPEHDKSPKQESAPVENPVIAFENNQTTTDNGSKKESDFPSTIAHVWLYQAKLLEMAQANVQFAFEFAQRLATARSPVDFFSAVGLLTGKRIDMLGKYSKEMFALSIKQRINPNQG